MLSITQSHWLTSNKEYCEMIGLSTDYVPKHKLANASSLYLMDKGETYRYDEDAKRFRQVGGSKTWIGTGKQTFFENIEIVLDGTDKQKIWSVNVLDDGATYTLKGQLPSAPFPVTVTGTCEYQEGTGYVLTSQMGVILGVDGEGLYILSGSSMAGQTFTATLSVDAQ